MTAAAAPQLDSDREKRTAATPQPPPDDTAGVIAPPPLIYLGALVVGSLLPTARTRSGGGRRRVAGPPTAKRTTSALGLPIKLPPYHAQGRSMQDPASDLPRRPILRTRVNTAPSRSGGGRVAPSGEALPSGR
jgi:hypothetical protein